MFSFHKPFTNSFRKSPRTVSIFWSVVDPRLVSEFYHGYNRSLRRFEEHFIRYYLSTIKECLEDEHIRKKYLQIQ